VWIAFVLTTDLYTNPDTGVPNSSPGGSNLAVDNIQMVNVSGTSIRDIQGRDAGVSIYPNPSTGQVRLKLEAEQAGQVSIVIHDILGKQVFSHLESVSSGNGEIQLDLTELAHGLYLIQTEVNDRFSITKLVIE
jgi:hypothetical protein